MKLSISNIGWKEELDKTIYEMMKTYGFCGLEIAPTRIIPNSPYDNLEQISEWYKNIREQYGFSISSMQSIWFGRTENIFASEEDRNKLLVYTKKAVDFAQIIGCKNLVFGCPRNRCVPGGVCEDVAEGFFKELGDYAAEHNTVIGMEANPTMYNTNYINDTASAIRLIERVDSEGFKLNLDIGTMLCNEETMDVLKGRIDIVNHVHISEPGLRPLEPRKLHRDIFDVLCNEDYKGFVSIEIGTVEDAREIERCMSYVRAILK